MRPVFAEGTEYKVVPTKSEYPGFTGSEKWIVITNLTPDELKDKYGKEIQDFYPWIQITVEQYLIMIDWRKNEDKHRHRGGHKMAYYGVDDSLVESLLGEQGLTESLEDVLFRDTQGSFDCLNKLTEIQKKRVMLHCIEDEPIRKIAKTEGKNYTTVHTSIKAGLKKIQNYYLNYNLKGKDSTEE